MGAISGCHLGPKDAVRRLYHGPSKSPTPDHTRASRKTETRIFRCTHKASIGSYPAFSRTPPPHHPGTLGPFPDSARDPRQAQGAYCPPMILSSSSGSLGTSVRFSQPVSVMTRLSSILFLLVTPHTYKGED